VAATFSFVVLWVMCYYTYESCQFITFRAPLRTISTGVVTSTLVDVWKGRLRGGSIECTTRIAGVRVVE
jgi:hypothetical protein